MSNKIKLGITQGDSNGISYEIIIKSLLDKRINELLTPIVYGSSKIAAYHRKALNIDNFNFNQINSVEDSHTARANILNCVGQHTKVDLGKNGEESGIASFLALDKATEDLKNQKIEAIVTAPINKENIKSEDFQFNGHTEYFDSKFEGESLMFMISKNLKLGFATNHLALKSVSDNLSSELLVRKLEIMNDSLKNDFNISIPKIAVLGLNPHSGENGVIGDEENQLIIPAIEQAKQKGIVCFGPFPADGFFGSDGYTKYDAVLSMYHDQGMVAFKLLSFDEGVNYTAGLEVVRTSPAHGTAYDIVGKGTASHQSMLNAIYLAVDIAKNRKQNTQQ